MRTFLFLLVCGASTMHAQFEPPKVKPPDEATIKQIVAKTAQLREAVAKAVKSKPNVAADLEIYVKAAEWIVRHNEWLVNDAGKQTLAVIDQGMKRAEAVQAGQTPWLNTPGKCNVYAYRSDIDDSLQPYAVWLPADFGQDPDKRYRLDIMLHGRDGSLTEVKFLNGHHDKNTPKGQDFVQIDIYGRGNNAYRWAGERDVFEAMEDFIKRVTPKNQVRFDRKVLKGFSMGGAGTWHIGLRHPGVFAVIQPGAGFTTTHGYIAGLPNPLPPHQEACLKIYDAINYAENAAMQPIVAYSGEIDKQKLAADNIEKRLKELKLTDRFTHLIGPGLEHKFPPEWQQAAEKELQKYVGAKTYRFASPEVVKFTTYTPTNGICEWVAIHALDKMYQMATIEAKDSNTSCTVTTHNIREFSMLVPTFGNNNETKSIRIDGQEITLAGKPQFALSFRKEQGKWSQFDSKQPRTTITKVGGTVGPMDHAFTGKFLCVVGTRKPLSPDMDKAAQAQLTRFVKEWDKYFRGTLTVKKDTEVTDADKATSHLILFGDPGSNKLIAEMLSKLPLTWDAKKLTFGGTTYDAATHLPMLIYPNGQRYVVLNSGHTFHDAEFRGTNAQLYPRLGDFAIVKPTPTAKEPAAFEVLRAGLFDEDWKVPAK